MLNKFLRENKVSKMAKEERNVWYNALSKPQKAVAICEDVLLQIKNQKYVMSEGCYVQLELDNSITQRTVNDILKKQSLDELIGAKSVTCNVCAIGSAFMSAVRLGNEVSTELLDINENNRNYYGDYDYEPGSVIDGDEQVAFTKLEEAFSEKEYRAMEYMFEDGYDIASKFGGDVQEALTVHFEDNYYFLTAEEKMIKMCKQVIKAGGYFFVEGVDLENNNK